MTYDRNYTWVKDYKDEIITVAEKSGFKLIKTDEIEIGAIKRSTEKTIKIKIQNILSNVNLMNYGHEFGESITLTSTDANGFLHCKGWCLDDHLLGLEIEYNNIDNTTFINLKDDFEKQFNNYKIIWTRLLDQ